MDDEKIINRQKDIEKHRKQLRKVIFDNEPKKTKKKKTIFTNFILSLMLVIGLGFSLFLIIDSKNRINELYEIINAIFVLIIIISIVISFPKSFYKNKSGFTVFTSFIIISAIVFNSLYLLNIIKLPLQSYIKDYSGKSLATALAWADENSINTTETFEYSDKTEKYKIISQSVKSNTLTKNIKKISFTVSNGPDYDKTVIIPDMSDMKTDDIIKFADENYLKNVQVIFEENGDKDNDTIISQSHTGKVKRNDSIIFTASLGEINKLLPIKIKDLKGEKLLSASTYLGKNGISYELTYDYSNKIKRGCIISSSVKKGTTVNPSDKVILKVSKGKEIKVPTLKNMSLKEVTKWIIENNLQMEYSDKYDDSIKKGKVISSNYKKGDVLEEETIINIVFSKGKLKMPSFKDLSSFKTWASTYEIKYEIKEEFSKEIPKDSIIKFSVKKGSIIKPEEPITVFVSKGEAVNVPDFIGMNKNEIQKSCNSYGIKCTFYNTLSDKKEGTAISQSINKGTEIAKGDNVDIEIATKKQSEVTKNNNQSNGSNGNKPNNNVSSNTNQTPTNDTPSCTSVIIRLNGSEVVPNEPASTCSNLKSKYGDAIICSYVSSDDGTNGFILNSSEIRNKEASSCNPVTAIIVKNN